ncbi:MAG: DUF927 domain-containing protein [Burkholderiaceae bacterium]|nr:DUF927 domain-containing protein [Burkholderiaceae bacterium]
MNGAHSESTIRAALAFVSPDLPRDEWVKVAFSIKAELGEPGFALFDEWSQGGKSYKARAVRTAWKSAKASGGISIGTLFDMAKASGFKLADHAPAAEPTEEERAELQRRRAEQARREKAERAAGHKDVAARAGKRWGSADEGGESPYLVRKGVGAHGVRFEPEGVLLVPMRDIAGRLWNVQAILPKALDDGSDKRFLKGGRVTGCLHWLGSPGGAGWLLVAEGYATAASLHEATRLSVACAFNCGNLDDVCIAIRKRFPEARLLVCADDNSAAELTGGRNAGVEAAQKAAKVARGHWVKPQGLPDDGADFNDLAAHAGLDEVGRQIRDAIAHVEGTEVAGAGGFDDHEHSAAAGQSASAAGDDRFFLSADGVYFDSGGKTKGGDPLPPSRICGPLEVVAESRDGDGKSWGLLLRWTDRDGGVREWVAPGTLLAGDGVELRKALRERGLWISPKRGLREMLIEYLETRAVAVRVRTVPVIGWSDGQFALPNGTIAPAGATERAVFVGLGEAANQFREQGTLEQWRDQVAALCVGNSRLLFAVSAAFTAPLLAMAEEPSGGFHFKGNSSTGKTTGLRMAASVYGAQAFMLKWRATDNALEAIAAQYSDSPLILDELGMLDAKAAGNVSYMLAEGMSKGRLARTATLKDRQSWRVLVLSSGEVGFGDLAREAGDRLQAGQEVRFAEIPADAEAGLGAFEALHGAAGPAEFVARIEEGVRACYGTAGAAWLRLLVDRHDDVSRFARRRVRELAQEWSPADASGQVARVVRRFALVAVGGELATRGGLTGWPTGAAELAARRLFEAWLELRGGAGRSEERDMLRQVQSFLEMHAASRFEWWHRAGDDRAPKTLNRAGFRKIEHNGREVSDDAGYLAAYGGEKMTQDQAEESQCTFYVLPEVFRRELCAGFDAQSVARLLERRGYLDAEGGRLARKVRLPLIGPSRCYVIRPGVFSGA